MTDRKGKTATEAPVPSKSGTAFPMTRPPKTQFPHDPDRASEAGFTFGEAGPEKPGRQMQTPPLNPTPPPPSAAERAQQDEHRKRRAVEAREQKLEDEVQDVTEEIGPRGNYRR